MKAVFGIHVGNCTACLALHKQDDSKGVVEVVANNAGDRVTAAVVTATEDEYVVGAACKSLMASRWNTTIKRFKTLLDRATPETSGGSGREATVVSRDGELCYELPLDTCVEHKTPAEIVSCVYSSLFEMAKSATPGEEDISCVLMVPRHFSASSRFKLQTAAEAVGWNVLQIINEPVASILGYNLLSERTPPPSGTVLVYRMGGCSCDASVLELNHGMVSSLDSEFSEDLGGKILIQTLTDYLADEFHRRYKLDPRDNHRSSTKLALAAESCLHVLSTVETANCFVESLCDGVDFSSTVSRARFESLLFPYLSMFAKPIHTVLSRLKINVDSLSTVLLCGGPLKIPRLRKHITDIFQETNVEIVGLPCGLNFDEILACGAARQAGYLTVEKMTDTFLPNEIEIPVLQSAVSVRVEGADFDGTDFPAGQPLPAVKNLTISSPSEKVKLAFAQNQNPGTFLKGELEIHKDDLEGVESLRLAIDDDFQISVAACEDSNLKFRHLVKMLESQDLQDHA